MTAFGAAVGKDSPSAGGVKKSRRRSTCSYSTDSSCRFDREWTRVCSLGFIEKFRSCSKYYLYGLSMRLLLTMAGMHGISSSEILFVVALGQIFGVQH